MKVCNRQEKARRVTCRGTDIVGLRVVSHNRCWTNGGRKVRLYCLKTSGRGWLKLPNRQHSGQMSRNVQN